jgi:hypothetical protein
MEKANSYISQKYETLCCMSTLQQTGLVFNDWSAMIPIRTVIECNGDECTICLGPIVCGEFVSDLAACGHTFHMACIVRWFTVKLQGGAVGCCPLCNAKIVQPHCETPLILEDIPVSLHLTHQEEEARENEFRRTAKVVFVVVVTCFVVILIILGRY